jgi:hypothetical protein
MRKGWLLLIVLLVGIFGFVALNRNQSISGDRQFIPGIGGGPGDLVSPEPSATPIRQELQSLLTQHGALASTHLEDIFDNRDDSETLTNLNNNSSQIIDFMVKQGASQDEFSRMWNGHITEYEKYTKALKNNDQAGMADAKHNLTAQAQHMGIMINNLLPKVPADQAQQLMQEHGDLTLSIIDAHAKGDSQAKLVQMEKANDNAIKMASILANAIEDKNLKAD